MSGFLSRLSRRLATRRDSERAAEPRPRLGSRFEPRQFFGGTEPAALSPYGPPSATGLRPATAPLQGLLPTFGERSPGNASTVDLEAGGTAAGGTAAGGLAIDGSRVGDRSASAATPFAGRLTAGKARLRQSSRDGRNLDGISTHGPSGLGPPRAPAPQPSGERTPDLVSTGVAHGPPEPGPTSRQRQPRPSNRRSPEMPVAATVSALPSGPPRPLPERRLADDISSGDFSGGAPLDPAATDSRRGVGLPPSVAQRFTRPTAGNPRAAAMPSTVSPAPPTNSPRPSSVVPASGGAASPAAGVSRSTEGAPQVATSPAIDSYRAPIDRASQPGGVGRHGAASAAPTLDLASLRGAGGSATSDADHSGESPQSAPQIHIGRIEIKASPPPPRMTRPGRAPSRPRLSLDSYLNRRRGSA